jgi:hypothetical protein
MLLTIRAPDKKLRAKNKSPRCDPKSPLASKSPDVKLNMEQSVHCFAQLARYKKRRMASETSIGTGVPSLQITVAHHTLVVRQEICYKRETILST